MTVPEDVPETSCMFLPWTQHTFNIFIKFTTYGQKYILANF